MVHDFCMFSHKALNLCEILWKYLKRLPAYRVDISTMVEMAIFNIYDVQRAIISKVD